MKMEFCNLPIHYQLRMQTYYNLKIMQGNIYWNNEMILL
jgi:hypothetical protein